MSDTPHVLSKELELVQLEVLDKIDKIHKTLTTNDPMLEVHCASVHKTLLEFEELVHILPDEKIHQLMAGMAKWKNVKLVEEATKSRTRKKVTADDL